MTATAKRAVGPRLLGLVLGALVGGAACSHGGDEGGCGICGCVVEVTLTFGAEVVDPNDAPVAGIELYCDDEATPIDTSDANGLLSFTIQTQEQPGCGYARCSDLTLHAPDGSYADVTGTYWQLDGETIVLVPTP